MGKKLILHILPLVLSVALFYSCSKEITESEEYLYSGYWLDRADPTLPLIKFDEDGNVFYYVQRYEETEKRYYVYYETSSTGRFAMDIQSGNFCFLPDGWYNIYVLDKEDFILGNPGQESFEMMKVSKSKVKVLSKSDFESRYPD